MLFQRRNNYFCFITIKERNFFMMCNFITHQIFCTLSFTRKNKLLILIELDRILKSSDGPKPKNFDFWVLKNHQLLSNSQKQSIRNCLPDLGGKSTCLLSRVLVDHAKKFSVLQKEELQQCVWVNNRGQIVAIDRRKRWRIDCRKRQQDTTYTVRAELGRTSVTSLP